MAGEAIDTGDASAGEDEYQVESVVDHSSKNLFYVKWKGYSETENTWEPVANLIGCEPFQDYLYTVVEPKQREKIQKQIQVILKRKSTKKSKGTTAKKRVTKTKKKTVEKKTPNTPKSTTKPGRKTKNSNSAANATQSTRTSISATKSSIQLKKTESTQNISKITVDSARTIIKNTTKPFFPETASAVTEKVKFPRSNVHDAPPIEDISPMGSRKNMTGNGLVEIALCDESDSADDECISSANMIEVLKSSKLECNMGDIEIINLDDDTEDVQCLTPKNPVTHVGGQTYTSPKKEIVELEPEIQNNNEPEVLIIRENPPECIQEVSNEISSEIQCKENEQGSSLEFTEKQDSLVECEMQKQHNISTNEVTISLSEGEEYLKENNQVQVEIQNENTKNICEIVRNDKVNTNGITEEEEEQQVLSSSDKTIEGILNNETIVIETTTNDDTSTLLPNVNSLPKKDEDISMKQAEPQNLVDPPIDKEDKEYTVPDKRGEFNMSPPIPDLPENLMANETSPEDTSDVDIGVIAQNSVIEEPDRTEILQKKLIELLDELPIAYAKKFIEIIQVNIQLHEIQQNARKETNGVTSQQNSLVRVLENHSGSNLARQPHSSPAERFPENDTQPAKRQKLK